MSTIEEARERIAEAKHYAERSLPRLYKNSFALSSAFLRSALFSAACKPPRLTHSAFIELKTAGDVQVWFKGEELRQDDERILLTLLKLRAGRTVDGVIEIPSPRRFCVDVLEWPDSSDGPAKLKASLLRLKDAQVRVTKPGSEQHYSFVSDLSFDSKAGWTVWLSQRLVQMFDDRVTYLSMEERLAVKDGLVSWLLGFIKSDACFVAFPLALLRELSGSRQEQKQFNEDARKAFLKLQQLGLLDSYSIERGAVRIRKFSGMEHDIPLPAGEAVSV